MPEMNLNYELAPRPGMLASQRKAELDGSKFVSVRNLAYMIYKKPDGSPLMTYQETLDNRELVKNNIINTEISMGLVQNDLGNTAVPTSQSPQPIQNGAQMTQPQQQQMPFPPQMQPQQAAPMSPQQFAQVPMGQPQQQPQYAPQPQQMQPPMQQPQYAQPQQAQQAPQPQYAAPAPQQFAQPQMQQMPPQMQPMAPMQPMAAPAAPPLETAPVTGKKRKAAAGNAVAPPPGNPVAPPPGFAPQPQAGVPVMQFQQPQAGVPFQPTQPGQPQFVPQQQVAQPQFSQPQVQQAPAPQAGGDFGAIIQRLDALGKGIEISANNGDQALKAVAVLKTELGETRALLGQMLVALHHMYLGMQGANGAPLLAHMTEGKANDLPSFRAFLQKYVGSPQ